VGDLFGIALNSKLYCGAFYPTNTPVRLPENKELFYS
jgi:hypothetical protein